MIVLAFPAAVCVAFGCRRNFGNVRDHIATEHTGWLHDHPGVLS